MIGEVWKIKGNFVFIIYVCIKTLLHTMEDELIELVPEGLTRGVSLREAYLVMLREKNGKRSIPTLVSRQEYALVLDALERREFPATRLATRLIWRLGGRVDGVHIHYSRTQQISALLLLKQGNEHITLNISVGEGIAFAIENKCPLLTLRSHFEAQNSLQSADGQVSLPINAMPDNLLLEAMETAVANDEFELAAALRDQMRWRKTQASLNAGYDDESLSDKEQNS